MPVTRAPSRISMPWLLIALAASLAIWSSAAARKSGNASSTVTSDPSRRQTLPSSRPITPAPMTPSRLGTSLNSSAPLLSTMRSPSVLATGMLMGSEPVAMMMFSALTVCWLPSWAVMATLPSPSSSAEPSMRVILFFLNSPAMPPVSCLTILSLRATMVGTSTVTSPTVMPWALN